MPAVEVRYGEEQVAEILRAVEEVRGRKVLGVRTVVTPICTSLDQPTGAYRTEFVLTSEEGPAGAGVPDHVRSGAPDL